MLPRRLVTSKIFYAAGKVKGIIMGVFENNANDIPGKLNQEWQDTFDAVSDSIFITNKNRQILKLNKATAELLDSAPNKLIGKKCCDLIHKNGCTPDPCSFEMVVLKGKPHKFTLFEDDTGKYFQISLSPLFDSHGEVNRVVHIIHDITPLKQSEAKIASINLLQERLLVPRKLEKKLKLITDAIVSLFDVSIARIWLTGPGDLCNQKCIHARTDKEEHRCQDKKSCLHLLASSGPLSNFDEAENRRVPIGSHKIGGIAAGVKPKYISNDILHDPIINDQSWKIDQGIVSFAGYRLLSETGSPLGVLCIFSKNITTPEIDSLLTGLANTTTRVILQTRAEEELQSTKNFLENIFNSSIPICITDLDHKLIRVNKSYINTFGPAQSDGNPLKCYESRPGPSCHTEKCPMPKIKNGANEVICESFKMMPSGEEKNFIVTAKPFNGPNGALLGIHESFQDISEYKRMERELFKMHNLDSLGYLAGGIAHDFNNLMTAVIGNIEIAKMYLPPQSPAADALENATEASMQTKDLTSRLLTFSKGGSPVMKESSLKTIIKDVSDSIFQSGEPAEHSKCSIHFADDLWKISGDQEQLKKAFHQILLNAEEATDSKGEITVKAENINLPSENDQGLQKGSYVLVTCNDRGRGIPENILPVVFNPYFSTKEMTIQKGVGLGLALCLSIINKHGGHISIESSKKDGTTVSVYLPAHPQIPPPKKEEERKTPAAAIKNHLHKGRILILEDEPLVYEVTEKMLKKLGYEPQWAQNGKKAIEMYMRASEGKCPFDAAIFDLTIKGGSGGLETFEHLLNYHPDIKGIVISGYTDNPVMANHLEHGFKAALCKPYSLTELKEALNKIWDSA